jgi:hypothetical protein
MKTQQIQMILGFFISALILTSSAEASSCLKSDDLSQMAKNLNDIFDVGGYEKSKIADGQLKRVLSNSGADNRQKVLSANGVLTLHPIYSARDLMNQANRRQTSRGSVIALNKCYAITARHVINGFAGDIENKPDGVAKEGQIVHGSFGDSCSSGSEFSNPNVRLQVQFISKRESPIGDFAVLRNMDGKERMDGISFPRIYAANKLPPETETIWKAGVHLNEALSDAKGWRTTGMKAARYDKRSSSGIIGHEDFVNIAGYSGGASFIVHEGKLKAIGITINDQLTLGFNLIFEQIAKENPELYRELYRSLMDPNSGCW